jgi:hypothetical protein
VGPFLVVTRLISAASDTASVASNGSCGAAPGPLHLGERLEQAAPRFRRQLRERRGLDQVALKPLDCSLACRCPGDELHAPVSCSNGARREPATLGITAASLLPGLSATLPDGMPKPPCFDALVLPMHVVVGALAAWLIPRSMKAAGTS